MLWFLLPLAALAGDAEAPAASEAASQDAPTEAPDPRRALVEAHGADDLAGLAVLSFRFEVHKGGETVVDRAWRWRRATGEVTRTLGGETLTFTWGQPEGEAEAKADAQFVNDSFWLSPPLHVSWAGDDLEVVDHGAQPLPIGEGTARKVTLQYASGGGGYTPGDAYDLFLGDDGRIAQWHYREGSGEEPSLTTTFEGWVQAGPLWVATRHESPDGSFVLLTHEVEAE